MAAAKQAYCVKCKEKRDIKNPVATFMKNGRPMTQGVCPVCGTKIQLIGNTPEHEGLTPPKA